MDESRLRAAKESIGIAEMARLSGLSADTLRWYEKEGLLPPVARGSDRRRRYDARAQDLVCLLSCLRATGMPGAAMKEFVELVAEGPSSHGRRVALLERTRDLLVQRRRSIDDALAALDAKTEHYLALIDAGLDCDGQPVGPATRARQRATHLPTSKDTP